MRLLYLLAADILVVIHAAYVGFVIFGMVAILIGVGLGWRWVRDFWFRIIHFLMIAVVVGEALGGIICPLTTWEDRLRQMAGQTVDPGTFMGRLCNKILFYEAPEGEFQTFQRTLTIYYCLFGAAVLATLVLAPPRLPPQLARNWQKGALRRCGQRLRLDQWLAHPDVGWLFRFLSGSPQSDTIQRPRTGP